MMVSVVFAIFDDSVSNFFGVLKFVSLVFWCFDNCVSSVYVFMMVSVVILCLEIMVSVVFSGWCWW